MMAHPTLTSIFGNPHPPHIAPTPIPLPRSLSCPLRSLHVTNLLAVLRDSDANLFIFIYFYLLLSHKSQAGSSPSPSLPPPCPRFSQAPPCEEHPEMPRKLAETGRCDDISAGVCIHMGFMRRKHSRQSRCPFPTVTYKVARRRKSFQFSLAVYLVTGHSALSILAPYQSQLNQLIGHVGRRLGK